MKKIYFPVLICCLALAGRAIAQVPTGEAGVSVAAQSRGIAGQPPAVPGQGIQQQGPIVSAQTPGSPYFYAYISDEDRAIRRVTLGWQLESEFNTDRFVLERSSGLNPAHFEPLHELVAFGGDRAGQAYRDQDNAPAGEIANYRLKIILKNGDAFYSPVVPVDLSDKIALSLKPSVLTAGGTLHLNTNTDPHQPMTINFFDVSGRKVGTYLVSSSYFDINTSGWTRGMYIYQISNSQHPLIEAGKIMVM